MRLISVFALIACAVTSCAVAPAEDGAVGPTGAYGVSVSHPLAAEAALDVLDRGGSAIDAAIAAQMVMTLVEPQSSGIGGGGFLVHYDRAKKKIETYDGREIAPASAREGMFLDKRGGPIPYRDAILGGRAVGVPGVIRMLELAHTDHGNLPWRDLFGRAIKLSSDGFAISDRLARQIAGDRHIRKVPGAKAYFYDGDEPKPAGAILKNPALAETLTLIAERGARVMYEGAIAEGIAQAVSTAPYNPAPMTTADIAAYQAKKRPAVCAPFKGYTVCGMGPPSSGGIATLQILGLLERFPLADLRPNAPKALHLIGEAGRIAFADRKAYVSDSDFTPVPIDGLIDRVYLNKRSGMITPGRAIPGIVDPGRPPGAAAAFMGPDDAEKGLSTAHMSIVDAAGNVASFTTTVESVFGSRLMVRGFLLNNQLTDFSFRPEWRGKSAPNRAGPGKRPRSSMSPTIVLDSNGDFVLATGSPGGSSIIGYTVRSVLGVLVWGLGPQAAADLPHVMSRGGPIEVEEPLIGEIPALRAMGHEAEIRRMRSGIQSLMRLKSGGLAGAADKRREGAVMLAGPATSAAWACPGLGRITVAFTSGLAQTTLGGTDQSLPRLPAASGARYGNAALEIWEHQGRLRVTQTGKPSVACDPS